MSKPCRLTREVGDRAGEATTLANMAVVLYRYLNRSQEAITKMEQAIAVLVETGLPQDAAGQTRDNCSNTLMRCARVFRLVKRMVVLPLCPLLSYK